MWRWQEAHPSRCLVGRSIQPEYISYHPEGVDSTAVHDNGTTRRGKLQWNPRPRKIRCTIWPNQPYQPTKHLDTSPGIMVDLRLCYLWEKHATHPSAVCQQSAWLKALIISIIAENVAQEFTSSSTIVILKLKNLVNTWKSTRGCTEERDYIHMQFVIKHFPVDMNFESTNMTSVPIIHDRVCYVCSLCNNLMNGTG